MKTTEKAENKTKLMGIKEQKDSGNFSEATKGGESKRFTSHTCLIVRPLYRNILYSSLISLVLVYNFMYFNQIIISVSLLAPTKNVWITAKEYEFNSN